jgi:hypothetical protein
MLLREERWIPDWIDSVKKKRYTQLFLVGSFMMLNTTFNNISLISLRSVLLVEETGEHMNYIFLLLKP